MVTDAELAIMDYLWTHGASVVRDISREVYAANTPAFHATVNSLLDQLEGKGFVSRDRSGFAHRFAATVNRNELVGSQLQRIADSHFGGALAPLVMPLVEKIHLSKRDREAIERILKKSH